mmetsp:Transcript_7485/g.5685  ORF Transcript_7485/g.5685 Transcript_7485/m.5685 type:complete len:80 (-) Transcript_7485:38-277(-)
MDYDMPVMNGLEATQVLCQKMKDKELKKFIPIVGLTAYNDERHNCMEAGMKRFMTKPASQKELKLTLQELLNGELHSEN